MSLAKENDRVEMLITISDYNVRIITISSTWRVCYVGFGNTE